MSEDVWVDWVKQIKAISQIGKTYTENPYDMERYNQLEAIAHAMFAQLADAPVEKVASLFIGDTGYATPKVDLRAGVFRDGEILLVKERTDDKWALPGGWADVNESPRIGIEREVWEESGYQAKALRLVAIKDHAVHPYFPKHPYHIYKLFFLCELTGGEATANMEVSEVGFFAKDAIPDLSLGRTLPEDLDWLWQHQDGLTTEVYCD